MTFLLSTGNIIDDRYYLIRELGSGGFSNVWLAEDIKNNSLQVALKIFAPAKGLDAEGLKVFSKEYAIVFNFNHAHLLMPKHFDDWQGRPYLVMQYMPNGSCFMQCGKMTETELARFIAQIAGAIAYLHGQENPVIHQDIKPDNVLIDAKGNYLLTDFGISSQMRRTLTRSMGEKPNSSGTIPYMGPERFGKQPLPTKESDIWSLGATLYELVTGHLPFGDHGGMLQKDGAEIPDAQKYCSAGAATIISACLHIEPDKRPNASQLCSYAEYFLTHKKWPSKTTQNKKGFKIIKRALITCAALSIMAYVVYSLMPTPKNNWSKAKEMNTKDSYAEIVETMPEYADSAIFFMYDLAILKNDTAELKKLMSLYPDNAKMNEAESFLKTNALNIFHTLLNKCKNDIDEATIKFKKEAAIPKYSENYLNAVKALIEPVNTLLDAKNIEYADTLIIHNETAPIIKEVDALISKNITDNMNDREYDPVVESKKNYTLKINALIHYRDQTLYNNRKPK